MEQPILTDRDQFPSEEIIYSHIGNRKSLWLEIFKYIHENHPNFAEQWRYYNDGKSWLLKVTNKAKTVFWLSVIKGTFRMTFYFGDKAEAAIEKGAISDELKAQFKNGKKYGKIRGLTVTFKNKKDIKYAQSLIEIKLAVK